MHTETRGADMPDSTADLATGFQLDEWSVYPEEGVLRSAEAERRLPPQLIDILVLLARHPGRLLTKKEIFEAVWKDAAVEEGALPRCISELRRALGDNARDPRIIQTVTKRGYVLVAPVALLGAARERSRGSPNGEPDPTQPDPTRQGPRLRAAWLPATGLLALLIAVLSQIGTRRGSDSDSADAKDARARPSIAVLAIANLSEEPDRQWLATALEEMLTTELAVSEKVRVVPAATVAEVRQELAIGDLPSARALGLLWSALGIDYGLTGSFLIVPGGDGDEIRLDLRVRRQDPEEVTAAVVETGTVRELGELSLLAGLRLRQQLGLGERLATERRLEETPGPTSPVAAHLYYRGISALRRLDARLATELLQQSLANAPDSPWAHHALAQAWEALGHDTNAVAAAKKAVALAGDLAPVDRLRIEANADALAGRWQAAIASLRELRIDHPTNLENVLALARMKLRASLPADAQTTLAELRRLAGESTDPRVELASAEAHFQLGQLQEALAKANLANDLAREQGAPSLAARALALRGRSLFELGSVENAEDALEEAIRVFAEVGDRRGQVDALGSLASWYDERGDAQRAEGIGRQALAVATEIGDLRNEALLLRRLAAHVWSGGDAEEAEAMFRRSIALSRERGDKLAEAGALTNFAVAAAIHAADLPIGEMFEQALELYREVGDRRGISSSLTNLGRVALLSGDLGKAVRSFEEAADIDRELGLKINLATTLFNLGYTRGDTGDVAGALDALEEAARLFRALDNPRMLASSLEGCGLARLFADDLAGAQKDLRESLSVLEGLDNPARPARILAGLARAHLAAGELEEAEELVRDALVRAEAASYRPVVQLVRRRLTEILLERGRWDAARREALELEESKQEEKRALSSIDNSITIARVLGATGDGDKARDLLEDSVQSARAMGAETLALEGSLALCELDLRISGDPIAVRSHLAAIRARAATLGLVWLERRARELERSLG